MGVAVRVGVGVTVGVLVGVRVGPISVAITAPSVPATRTLAPDGSWAYGLPLTSGYVPGGVAGWIPNVQVYSVPSVIGVTFGPCTNIRTVVFVASLATTVLDSDSALGSLGSSTQLLRFRVNFVFG